MQPFTKPFTQQEPIPEAAIEAATAILRSGRLHRYNVADGELSETALLEQEFAALLGVPYCLATASGGAAMQVALTASGVGPGDQVMTNAFADLLCDVEVSEAEAIADFAISGHA